YPASASKGVEIRGLAEAMAIAAADPELAIFHAGTRRDGDVWRTNGGRVLGVCARGPDLRAALARAYALLDRIELPGGQFRRGRRPPCSRRRTGRSPPRTGPRQRLGGGAPACP